jgi:organic radical activating enzyme
MERLKSSKTSSFADTNRSIPSWATITFRNSIYAASRQISGFGLTTKKKNQFHAQVKTVANETKLYSQELESHLAKCEYRAAPSTRMLIQSSKLH